MSEISDYKKKVKTLTYAELVDEVKRWKAQQAQATGEYGYWGGVNGQEIVEAEMETRTGKVYEIKNNFVDDDGFYREKGKIVMENQLSSYMIPGLIEHGIIKEAK